MIVADKRVENDSRAQLEHWIKTLSKSEVEQIELSAKQSGVIQLEDLSVESDNKRFQEHSIRACDARLHARC